MRLRNEYPLWQYPIIFLFLLHYLIKIRFRIKALISWRREIGLISKEHKITFSDIMAFGHWLAGETIIDCWYRKKYDWQRKRRKKK